MSVDGVAWVEGNFVGFIRDIASHSGFMFSMNFSLMLGLVDKVFDSRPHYLYVFQLP